MLRTKKNNVLTQDELDFIGEMRFEGDTEINAGDMRFGLSSDGINAILLNGLMASEQLKIQAYYEDYKFIFPLSIGKNEFDQFYMELKSPEILEIGSYPRHWRYKFEQPLTCRSKGEKIQFLLYEISSSGFCLDLATANAPETLELELALPNGEIMECTAQKVRPTSAKKTAYTMTLTTRTDNSLRSFLFTQHRLLRTA
jgi:hypothetical protein